MVVTALDARARYWWDGLGFHPFDPNDPTTMELYLVTSEIGATLQAEGARPPPAQG